MTRAEILDFLFLQGLRYFSLHNAAERNFTCGAHNIYTFYYTVSPSLWKSWDYFHMD